MFPRVRIPSAMARNSLSGALDSLNAAPEFSLSGTVGRSRGSANLLW
jgi:hypothetical protein